LFHETGYNSHMISLIRIIYRKNRSIVSSRDHALSAVNALPSPVGLSGSSSEKYNSSYIVNFPATHGLDATRKPSSRLSTHAALVFQAQSKNFLLHFKSASFFTRPATHGLDVQGLTLIDRIEGSAVNWTSTHAALVFLSDGHANLRFTNLPLAQNNDSHSEYMPPVSQRLNYPGNILPPGLQLILHSTFVIAGAIPSIEILQLLSNIHRRFMWLSPINSPRGERSG